MPELLIELYSEEIPARMQKRAAAEFAEIMQAKLGDAGIAFANARSYVTPQRVVFVAEDIPAQGSATREEKRGPRVDAPPAALQGFLKSSGLSEDQLEQRDTGKGIFYFATVETKSQPTKDVLPAVILAAMQQLSWPKSMRWGDFDVRWVRPLKSILCVFDNAVVPVAFGPVQSGDRSCGHRFMGKEFTAKNSKEYFGHLEKNHVMIDAETRRQTITTQAGALAAAKKLQIVEDAALLEETAGLVEWPVVRLGRIESRFMHLPPEVLMTSMRAHQKYFSTRDESGKIAPHFAVVTNVETADDGALIVAGNERVLRARLSDAAFFFEQDKVQKLEAYAPKLNSIVFHAKLGTIGERVTRLMGLAKLLSVWVPHANLLQAERAAALCKADLVTQMVQEFPELQGRMGYYYALSSYEEKEVAEAIRDHYAPLGPDDMPPTAPLAVVLALADKIDLLAGMFAIDEAPTGSKDPFALRRAALGVIRIIIENKLKLPLKLLLDNALKQYPQSILARPEEKEEDENAAVKVLKKLKPKPKAKQRDVVDELLEFFEERIKAALKLQDIRHDLISAVFDEGSEDDVLLLIARAHALADFLATDDGANLLTAYRRAANILKKEEERDEVKFEGKPSKSLLKEPEEQALYEALESRREAIELALKENRYADMMARLSELRKPVDAFFDKVKVNADEGDLRQNRLILLANLRELFNNIANFSKIEG